MANAAVAHALCFTLTSTGPARHSAWPRNRPRLTRRLCLVGSAGKRTRGYLACSLPNRNPNMMAILAWQTEIRGLRARSLVPSYKPRARGLGGSSPGGSRAYRPARSCADEGYSAPVLFGAVPFGAGTPGNSRVAVSPPPGVSVSLAVPPFEEIGRAHV